MDARSGFPAWLRQSARWAHARLRACDIHHLRASGDCDGSLDCNADPNRNFNRSCGRDCNHNCDRNAGSEPHTHRDPHAHSLAGGRVR